MQFTLNEDQIAIRDMARAFAAEKVAPFALQWDETKHFPVDVISAAVPSTSILRASVLWART